MCTYFVAADRRGSRAFTSVSAHADAGADADADADKSACCRVL